MSRTHLCGLPTLLYKNKMIRIGSTSLEYYNIIKICFICCQIFQDSDGSGSIASTASRSSPSPYDTVRKLPSVPTSASLPAAESRESLVRPRDSSLPSPSKLAVYAAARRRSAESAKDTNKRTHHYRIQF